MSDPTAVMGRRSVAWIVDLLLYLLLMSFFSATPLSPFAKYEEVPEGFDDPCSVIQEDDDVYQCFRIGDRVYYTETGASVLGFAVALAWFFGIYGVLQGVKGVTPGKALLGVRTVNEHGQVPGIGKSLARSVLWIVDGIPYCFPLVAVVTGFSTKGHRRVGDMAAKTFVIGKDDVGRPVVVPGLTTGYPGGYGPPGYGPPGGPGQPPWGPPPGGPGAPAGQPPWGAPTPAPGPGVWGQPAPTPGAPPSGSPYDQRPAPPSGGWAAPGADAAPTPSGEQPPAAGTPGTPWAGPTADAGPTPSGERPPAAGTPGTTGTPAGGGDEPTAIPLGPSPADTGATPPSGDDEPTATPLGPSPSGVGPSTGDQTTPFGESPGPSTGDRPAGSAQPTDERPGAEEPQPATRQASTGYEPQWDAARNTYIVWEPNRRQWLGWDDAAKQWRPL
jgi:hypothetical protein